MSNMFKDNKNKNKNNKEIELGNAELKRNFESEQKEEE